MVFGAAFLSVTAALGCGPSEDDLNGDGEVDYIDKAIKKHQAAADAVQYPPCGPEMPFSLAFDGVSELNHLDGYLPSTPSYAAEYSYSDTLPSTVLILWGDFQFIAVNLNTSFPKDGKGQFFVDGTMRPWPSGAGAWPIAKYSLLTMEETKWTFYFEMQAGEIWGVLCDNRTTK